MHRLTNFSSRRAGNESGAVAQHRAELSAAPDSASGAVFYGYEAANDARRSLSRKRLNYVNKLFRKPPEQSLARRAVYAQIQRLRPTYLELSCVDTRFVGNENHMALLLLKQLYEAAGLCQQHSQSLQARVLEQRIFAAVEQILILQNLKSGVFNDIARNFAAELRGAQTRLHKQESNKTRNRLTLDALAAVKEESEAVVEQACLHKGAGTPDYLQQFLRGPWASYIARQTVAGLPQRATQLQETTERLLQFVAAKGADSAARFAEISQEVANALRSSGYENMEIKQFQNRLQRSRQQALLARDSAAMI